MKNKKKKKITKRKKTTNRNKKLVRKESLKKVLIIRTISILFFIVFSLFLSSFIYIATDVKYITIKDIKYDYLKDENKINITIDISSQAKHTVFCALKSLDEKEIVWEEAVNNKCSFNTSIEDKYIVLKSEDKESNPIKLSKYIDGVIDYELFEDEIYLAPSESTKINQKIVSIKDIKFKYKLDKNIATINDEGVITAVSPGETELKIKTGNKTGKVKIKVSNLIIQKPLEYDLTKEYLPCERYSYDEAQELDKILENKVKRAGYKTRAGVVEAARFLTLNFPYKINYYLENGRLDTSSGTPYVDGEGRYYHKGLYLDSSKYESIVSSFSGPSMWGCPLPYNNYYKGYSRERTNGLDCSGYITWCFVNGGFDPKDAGAGDFPYSDKSIEEENTYRVTEEFLNRKLLKAGDIIYYYGHVAMVAGIKDNDYYVTEALWYDPTYAVVIKKYSKAELIDEFSYVMLLDDYYKEQGNYTEYWG
jgi:hypothetical protein